MNVALPNIGAPKSVDPTEQQEFTLDSTNWSDLRALGHRMLDDMLSYLETVRERPVWRRPPSGMSRSVA